MAKVLKAFEFKQGGQRGSYPWDEWADGQIRELKRGEDWTASKGAIVVMQARKQAKRRGMTVRANIPDADTVVLQFIQPDSEPKPSRRKR